MAPQNHTTFSTSENDKNTLERLERLESAAPVTMSRQDYERLYLTPKTAVKGDLRKVFGNPTPLALIGFVVAATPLSCSLMGWRGSGGGGAAIVGMLYFFGGLLQIIGSIMEWIIGNTFPFVVFGTFGAFWLAFAATLTPFYNAEASFLSGGANEAAGMAQFYNSFAFALLFFGLLVFILFICSFRTNVAFVVIFLLLTIAVALLAATYWELGQGQTEVGIKLEKIAGGFTFALCLVAWYILAGQLLQCVDSPIVLPVGDLSMRVPSATSRARAKDEEV